MKQALSVLFVGMFVVAAASAEKIPNDTPGSNVVTDCDVTGYLGYTGPGGAIPDADPNGIILGPVQTDANGDTFDDVILSVNFSHTWLGHLRMSLFYDADCDGVPEMEASVLCRVDLDGCPPDGCCGCSGDMGGTYTFDDIASAGSIEAQGCPSFFAPGCYGPDLDSTGLDVLDGMTDGGCFWLFVQDGAGGDTGFVEVWDAYVLPGGGATPTVETSWGSVKADYR